MRTSRVFTTFTVTISLLLLCSCNDPLTRPSKLDGALEEIKVLRQNETIGAVRIEIDAQRILIRYGIENGSDPRLLAILSDLRNDCIKQMARVAECSGRIINTELVHDEYQNEWVFVYYFENGSTYYNWYDSNLIIVESGCF